MDNLYESSGVANDFMRGASDQPVVQAGTAVHSGVNPAIDPVQASAGIGGGPAAVPSAGKKPVSKGKRIAKIAGIVVGVLFLAFAMLIFLAPKEAATPEQRAAQGGNEVVDVNRTASATAAAPDAGPVQDTQSSVMGSDASSSQSAADPSTPAPAATSVASAAPNVPAADQRGGESNVAPASPATTFADKQVAGATTMGKNMGGKSTPAASQPTAPGAGLASANTSVVADDVRLSKLQSQVDVLTQQITELKALVATLQKEGGGAPRNEVHTDAAAPVRPQHIAKLVQKPQRLAKVSHRVDDDEVIATRVMGKASPRTAGKEPMVTESAQRSDPSEDVRVLGVTQKEGGSFVVIAYAGTKARYGRGDMVPGLGKISDFGTDSGVPYVSISGVTYR
jgi:predicted SpoU family rRNA methylase